MIGPPMLPVAPARVGCKCCGVAADLAGVVDFHKNCEAGRGLRVVEPLGWVFGSFSDNLHVLFRRVPAFAAHLITAAA